MKNTIGHRDSEAPFDRAQGGPSESRGPQRRAASSFSKVLFFLCVSVALWLLLSLPLFAQAPVAGVPAGTEAHEGKCWKVYGGKGDWGDCGAGGGIPSGAILLIVSGACPAGFTEEATLNGKTLFGTLNANADVGGTGGSDTIMPSGSVTSNFSGTPNQATSSDSAGTPAGSVTSSFAGNALPAHPHGPGTLATASASTGISVAAHATGSTGTSGSGKAFANAAAASHSVTDPGHPHSSLTGSTEAVSAGTPTGIVNSSFAGTSLPAHPHNFTPAGSVTSSFSGNQFDNRSAFVRVIFCKKD